MNISMSLSTGTGSRVCWSRCAGLSLTELLITLTISLLILGALGALFVQSSSTFRTLQGTRTAQESLRYAMLRLDNSVQMAGHFGATLGMNVDPGVSITGTGTGNCNQAWAVDTDVAVQGFDGDAAPPVGGSAWPLGFDCLAAGDYVPNTDVLVLRYADAESESNADVAGVTSGRIYARVRPGAMGMLFAADDYNDPATLPGPAASPTTLNHRYTVEAFFIRPCLSKDGEATCAAAGVPDKYKIPTLVRLRLNGSNVEQEPIIDGIEQLQVAYGVAVEVGGEDSVRYHAAGEFDGSAGAPEWEDVVAVRLSLVARSLEREVGLNDTSTYTLLGGSAGSVGGVDYVPDASVADFRRIELTREIQIRNRAY